MYFQTSKNQTYCKQRWNGLSYKEKTEGGVRLFKMSSTIKRKSGKFPRIGESAETNSESVTMGETHRIIMRDGFHYFAATE